MSTVYFALFHCLAGCCADTLIGKNERKTEAWRRAYRALNHGEARKACRRSGEIRVFPKAARSFARLFADLQDERHAADYDPGWSCFKSDITSRIRDAESAIDDFESLGLKARRAFAAHVLFRKRS